MPNRIIHVDTYTRNGDEQVAAHQRALVSGPATRWLAPERQNPDALLAPLAPAPLAQNTAYTAHENSGSEEYATPVSRAQGQILRLLPFSIIWLLLGIGITWLLGLTMPYLLLWFSGLTAATYWRLNKDEFQYSRNGLERHKVDAALKVQIKELDQSHELRKIALQGYLNHINGGNTDGQ